jgi:hypothetical protein
MGDSSDREKSVPKSKSKPSTVKGKKRVVVAMGLNSEAMVNSSVRVERFLIVVSPELLKEKRG